LTLSEPQYFVWDTTSQSTKKTIYARYFWGDMAPMATTLATRLKSWLGTKYRRDGEQACFYKPWKFQTGVSVCLVPI